MAEEEHDTEEVTDAEETTETTGQEQGGPDPEIEARAREMGWVPPEEFRGGAENALSAEEFVRRGEQILPIVNKRNRELEKKLQAMQGDVKELVRQMGEQRRSSHEQQIADRKQARDKALEDGDTDTVRRYDQEIEKLQQKAPQAPQEAEPGGWTPEFTQLVDQFKDQNSDWYGKDALRTKEFADYHDFLLTTNPDMGDEERLEAARKAVFEKYPRQTRRKSSGSPVEGGGTTQRKGSSRKKGYDDLPPEAKQAYDKFVTQQKVMKGEEYLREFFGEEYEG